MISVQRRERIRRAYYVEGKSMRQIASEMRHSYWTVRDAIESAAAKRYTLQAPKAAPKLGPYQQRIDELLLRTPAANSCCSVSRCRVNSGIQDASCLSC